MRIGPRESGEEDFSYLNQISIKKFNRLLAQTPFFSYYYKIEPVRPWARPLVKLPGINEFFTSTVVAILEKRP